MRIGVLLAGSGVFDGSEIHEAVYSLLAIDENDAEPVIFAPDKDQHHVVNHITGEEMNESRNVLTESARIARGNIKSLNEVTAEDFDALVIPGGFGVAKNLNKWAFEGPKGDIDEKVKAIILETHKAKKPIAALCMGPTVVAKAFEGSGISPTVTIGTTEAPSPYDIKGTAEGVEVTGAKHEMKTIDEISIDEENLIVTAPCYMMEASFKQIRLNAKLAIDKLVELAKQPA